MNDELTKIDKTTAPKHIAAELAASTERISKLMKRRQAEPPQPLPDRTKEIDEELENKGYPRRHRQNLAEMSGPGLQKAQQLLPRLVAGDCILLLVGDRGPGKTQMATFWAQQRMLAGKTCGIYRKTADILTEIKTTWQDGGKTVDTENDILRKYRKVGYLVLDEFHERGSSDWEARTLINIIDHRYDNMLATVIIANMSEKDVRLHINPSIISRSEETGGLVLCDWPSYRVQP